MHTKEPLSNKINIKPSPECNQSKQCQEQAHNGDGATNIAYDHKGILFLSMEILQGQTDIKLMAGIWDAVIMIALMFVEWLE